MWNDLNGDLLDLTRRLSPSPRTSSQERAEDVRACGRPLTTQAEIHGSMYPSLESVSSPDGHGVTYDVNFSGFNPAPNVKPETHASFPSGLDQATSLMWDYPNHGTPRTTMPQRSRSMPVFVRPSAGCIGQSNQTPGPAPHNTLSSQVGAASTPHLVHRPGSSQPQASRPSLDTAHANSLLRVTAGEQQPTDTRLPHTSRSPSRKHRAGTHRASTAQTFATRTAKPLVPEIHPVVLPRSRFQIAASTPQAGVSLPQYVSQLRPPQSHLQAVTSRQQRGHMANHVATGLCNPSTITASTPSYPATNAPTIPPQHPLYSNQHFPWLLTQGLSHYLPPHVQHSLLGHHSALAPAWRSQAYLNPFLSSLQTQMDHSRPTTLRCKA